MADTEIWEGAIPYWVAFHTLHRGRGRDMGEPVPIREADLLAHARAFGFADTGLDLEEFCDVLTALDQIVLLHHAKTRAAPAPVGSAVRALRG